MSTTSTEEQISQLIDLIKREIITNQSSANMEGTSSALITYAKQIEELLPTDPHERETFLGRLQLSLADMQDLNTLLTSGGHQGDLTHLPWNYRHVSEHEIVGTVAGILSQAADDLQILDYELDQALRDTLHNPSGRTVLTSALTQIGRSKPLAVNAVTDIQTWVLEQESDFFARQSQATPSAQQMENACAEYAQLFALDPLSITPPTPETPTNNIYALIDSATTHNPSRDELTAGLYSLLHNSSITSSIEKTDVLSFRVQDAQGNGITLSLDPAGDPTYTSYVTGTPPQEAQTANTLTDALANFQNQYRSIDGNLTVFTQEHCPACKMTQRELSKPPKPVPFMVLPISSQNLDALRTDPKTGEPITITSAPIVEVAGRDRFGGMRADKLKEIRTTFGATSTKTPPAASPHPKEHGDNPTPGMKR